MKSLRLVLSSFLAIVIFLFFTLVATPLCANAFGLDTVSSLIDCTGSLNEFSGVHSKSKDGIASSVENDLIRGTKSAKIESFTEGAGNFYEKKAELFDPPLGQIVDCEDGDEYFSRSGYSIVFTGYSHDSISCRTCFYYCVQNNEETPNINHYLFGYDACEETCLDEMYIEEDIGLWVYNNGFILRNPGAGGPYLTGEDPSTGFCGVRADKTLGGDGVDKVFICVDGLHGIGWIKGVFSTETYEYIDIPGPEVCEGTCVPGGNPDDCGFCDVINGPVGPVCPSAVDSFDAQIIGVCGNPVYTWTVTGDHAGYTANGSSITVTAGSSCGMSYTVSVSIACEDCTPGPLTCHQFVEIGEVDLPSIICPLEISTQCDQSTSPEITGFPTVTDNCSTSLATSYVDLIIAGSCADEFIIERTWSIESACFGNLECVQIITVSDETAPAISCPVDVSIDCNEDTSPITTGSPTAFDNCTVEVTNFVHQDIITPGNGPYNYTIERIWTATDACGNQSHCAQTITIEDATPPFITCPVDVTLDCDVVDTSPQVLGFALATDNCTDPVTDIVHEDNIIPGNCPSSYTIERTWTATDEYGNQSQCIQIITIDDTSPPSITIVDPRIAPLGDTTIIQCYGQDPAWVLPVFDESSVVATDSCSPTVTVDYSVEVMNEGNCEEDGYIMLYRLVWTAVDECGNSSSVSVMLALVDNIAPVIFGVPEDITVNCDEIPAPPPLVYATDECLCACVVLLEETPIQGACQDGQAILRTWTASDRCGNTTVATQRITIVDNVSPQLVMLQPELKGLTDGAVISYTCSYGPLPNLFYLLSAHSVIALDACGGAPVVNFSLTNSIDPDNCEFNGYKEQLTAQWTAVDACGNETSMTIFARLIDTEAPVLFGVPETTCFGDPALLDIYATDNCGVAFTHFWDTPIPNPCGNGEAILRTYEAYDDCRNRSTETCILVPNENNPPLMEFVNPLLIGLDSGDVIELVCDIQNGGYTSFDAEDIVAVSACSESVEIAFTEKLIESRDCTTGKLITILELRWTAIELCGSVGVLTLEAHVSDNSKPEFTNFQSAVTLGCLDPMPVYTTEENCSDVTVTMKDSIVAGECELEYVIHRVVTATDYCGNVTTRLQTITIGDGKGPIIEGVVNDVCDDLTIPNITAYDDCAREFVPVTMEQDTIEVNCQSGMVIVRTWLAVGVCGDTSMVEQTITMDDKSPPEIQIPWYSVIQYYKNSGRHFAYFSDVERLLLLSLLDENSVDVYDECGLQITPKFSVEVSPGDCIKDGFTERRVYTWVATDICGNVATFSFTVHILDDIPPTLDFNPSDYVVACEDLPSPPTIRVDKRAGETIAFNQIIVPGVNPGEYIVTRKWVATDVCGNEQEIVQTITWIPENTLECELLVPDNVDCNRHGLVIGSDVTGGNGPFTYEWEIQGEKCFIQAGQGTPRIIIYVGWSQVKIILTVTDAYGCVSMCMYFLECNYEFWQSNAQPLTSTAADQQNNSDLELSHDGKQTVSLTDLTVWPNPTDGNVNLSFKSTVENEVLIAFTNLLGQVVKNEQYSAHNGFNLHKTNIDFLEPGSYLMQVTTAKERHTKVIVVARQ